MLLPVSWFPIIWISKKVYLTTAAAQLIMGTAIVKMDNMCVSYIFLVRMVGQGGGVFS